MALIEQHTHAWLRCLARLWWGAALAIPVQFLLQLVAADRCVQEQDRGSLRSIGLA